MKLKKREIFFFTVLLVLTLLCKQSVLDVLANRLGLNTSFNAEHLKLAGVLLNVTIGYIGLVKHEVKWIKIAWLSVYGILFSILIANRITRYVFGLTLAEFDYTLFASPVFYLAACILPRYVNLDKVDLTRQKAK